MSARDIADRLMASPHGSHEDTRRAALDAHQSEVLRSAADLFESACPDGPGPVRFDLCQCTAASELRTMAEHPELIPKAGGSRG